MLSIDPTVFLGTSPHGTGGLLRELGVWCSTVSREEKPLRILTLLRFGPM